MGGLIYHRLGERFNSPTIDLNMQTSDFCAFLENLDYYPAQDVIECVDPKPFVNAPVGIIKGNGSDIRDIRINLFIMTALKGTLILFHSSTKNKLQPIEDGELLCTLL